MVSRSTRHVATHGRAKKMLFYSTCHVAAPGGRGEILLKSTRDVATQRAKTATLPLYSLRGHAWGERLNICLPYLLRGSAGGDTTQIYASRGNAAG